MIGRLCGQLAWRQEGRAIIDVHGVGYEVFATARGLDGWALAGDAPITAMISTQVREDAITLYAFPTPEEREAFEVLLSVTGIGPKLALALLDGLDLGSLRQAVETDDYAALAQVNGVGRKTAQRLALELKGKLPASAFAATPARAPVAPTAPDPFDMALTRLGWMRAEVESARARIDAAGLGGAPVAERVRYALKTSIRG